MSTSNLNLLMYDKYRWLISPRTSLSPTNSSRIHDHHPAYQSSSITYTLHFSSHVNPHHHPYQTLKEPLLNPTSTEKISISTSRTRVLVLDPQPPLPGRPPSCSGPRIAQYCTIPYTTTNNTTIYKITQYNLALQSPLLLPYLGSYLPAVRRTNTRQWPAPLMILRVRPFANKPRSLWCQELGRSSTNWMSRAGARH